MNLEITAPVRAISETAGRSDRRARQQEKVSADNFILNN